MHSPNEYSKSERVNVLIVDDRTENLLSLERILRAADLEVVQASSGNEALGKLLERDFACVLLDVQMPGMDGFETAEFIRNDPVTAHVPILFVTAYSKEQTAVYRGYDLGAVDYLTKPLEPRTVKGKVSFFASQYRQQKTIERQSKELAEVNARLRLANEDLKRFNAVVAHDIRSPLATIISMAGFLKSVIPDPGEMGRHYLDRILTIGEHVAHQIEDLLEFSTLDHCEPRLDEVDTDSLVEQILSYNEASIREAKATITRGSLPIVKGDPGLFFHLFQNLILNAVKYRSKDRALTVTIDSERAGSFWHFVVTDNGIGICQDDLKKVFLPFKKVERSGASEGKGMGLAICERIVSLHGGRIWAESNQGEGSSFHFLIKDLAQELTRLA